MPAESIANIQIANIALSLCGEPTITSFAATTKGARLVDLRFLDVRDAVLRAHPWNCATKRAVLSVLAEKPAFGYDVYSQLPEDFLRLHSLEHPDIPFKIEGRRILSNVSPIKMRYVYTVDDTTELDDLCRQAIAARLAHEICIPLARSQERAKSLWETYMEKLSEARFVDATESVNDQFHTDQFLDGRIVGTRNSGYRGIS